jgi:hypothetical protein
MATENSDSHWKLAAPGPLQLEIRARSRRPSRRPSNSCCGRCSKARALNGATLYAVLPQASLESWGWRLPFLLGLLIAPIGLYIRANLDETHRAASHESSPVGRLLREHGGFVLKGIPAKTAGTATMYLVVFFMPTYMIRMLHMPPSLSLLSGCVTGFSLLVVSLVAGVLADRLPRRKPLVIGSPLFSVIVVLPSFWLMSHYPSVPLVLGLSALLTAGINPGSTPIFLMKLEMLPIGVRASGILVVYSIGVTVFGGSSQFIVTWLLSTTGHPMSPAFYMIVCGVLS